MRRPYGHGNRSEYGSVSLVLFYCFCLFFWLHLPDVLLELPWQVCIFCESEGFYTGGVYLLFSFFSSFSSILHFSCRRVPGKQWGLGLFPWSRAGSPLRHHVKTGVLYYENFGRNRWGTGILPLPFSFSVFVYVCRSARLEGEIAGTPSYFSLHNQKVWDGSAN